MPRQPHQPQTPEQAPSGQAPRGQGSRAPRHVTLRAAGAVTVLAAAAVALGAFSWFTHEQTDLAQHTEFARPIQTGPPPVSVTSLSAEECGRCHAAIYAEWRTTMHARAWTDPLVQSYWKKEGELWVCRTCHTPLEAQQPVTVLAVEDGHIDRPVTEPNEHYDPALVDEGVTCASCHVRGGTIFGPNRTPAPGAPHPTAYDPNLLSPEACYRCHQVPDGAMPFFAGGPCADDFQFRNGPYARNGYTCQSCHMPTVDRAVASGSPVRSTRSHIWRGGHAPEMLRKALTVRLAPDVPLWGDGQRLVFTARLTNSGAGHPIPIGDPNRHFTVHWELINDKGRVVRHRTDKVIRRILWKPVTVEVKDGRIAPLSFRDFEYKVRSRRGWRLRVTVNYHILTAHQKKGLVKRHGLPPATPDHIDLYRQEVDLSPGALVPSEMMPVPSPVATLGAGRLAAAE
ncbi:MAG: hypothetical protein OEW11_08625 [Nitrospirota bacterium]|nr:hypothetical protein [Nitrospirota bacterium]